MEELFKQLLKEVEKGTMGMAVLSARQKDGKSAQEILSDFDEEYDPNSEACKKCEAAELCKIVSKIKKSEGKTDKKVQPSEKSADERFKELLGDMADAGDWLLHNLVTIVNKGKDYGDTFRRLARRDAHYPTNQMLTKIYRIENLLADEKKDTNFESIEDSLADLIGYVVLTYKAIKDGDLK